MYFYKEKKMKKADKSNFLKFIVNFPAQIVESEKIIENSKLNPIDLAEINQILICGMGGSAIAGDILSAYLENELPVPINVNRKEFIPAYVSEKTLIIISSNSGNTAETLAAYNQAVEKKAQLLIITSGGKLIELAKENNIPLIKIPSGYPPRQAFGFAFFTLLYQFSAWKWITLKKEVIDDVKNTVKIILKRNAPEKPNRNHLAFNIARELNKKIPILYSASSAFEPILTRWRNQINENSKSLAFSNIIPEMNHNEIVGWEMNYPANDNLVVVFLQDVDLKGERKKRLKLTKEIISKKCQNIVDVYPEGKTKLGKMISMIYLGDWVSYYLAMFYGKDPIDIKNIDYLKSKLNS